MRVRLATLQSGMHMFMVRQWAAVSPSNFHTAALASTVSDARLARPNGQGL